MSENKTPEKTKQDLTNTYMSRLLCYIRDDNVSFSQFIQHFDELVNKSAAEIAYVCDEHNNTAQHIDIDTDLVYLQQLVNKLGISLSYFPSDYDSSIDTNNEQLKQLYLTAIRGAVIIRTGEGTKASIKEALENMYPEATIIIEDGGIEDSVGAMNVNIFIKDISATINDAILSLYLKQNITGVMEVFEFDVDGTAVFAPIDPKYLKQDASVDMEIANGTELTELFTNTNVEPYNKTETKPTGKGGYMFMDYNSTNDTEIAITKSKDNNEKSINYLNTGFWLITLI